MCVASGSAAIGTVDGRSSTTPHAATGAIWRRALVTATSVVAVESGVRHLVLRKKPGTVGYDRKQSRCGLPSQHALLQAWEKKDYTVSYTHLRAHETRHDLVCRLLLE